MFFTSTRDNNVKVKSPFLGFRYKIIFSEHLYNVSKGKITTVDLPIITMDDDDGQAMQIAQAALTARDYAWIMNSKMPSNVKIKYPANGDGCYYTKLNNKIHITKGVFL